MVSTKRPKAIAPEPLDWEAEEFEPLRLDSTKVEPVDTVPLFYIDNVEYRIPKTFSASLALRYLKRLREIGEEAAVGQMLEETIGEDSYTALMNYDHLTSADLNHIMRVVGKLLLGSLDQGKEPSSNGSRRLAG